LKTAGSYNHNRPTAKRKKMYKIVLLACAVSLLAACNSENTQSSTEAVNKDSANQQGGDVWISLFDGKTTTGWHRYGGGPAGTAWKVAEGALYLDTTGKKGWQTKDGGDLVSDEEYENFHLKLEWKIAPGGNSGIIFYVAEDSAKYEETWNTGPEMQIVDDQGHPDGKIVKHQAGDLYDLIASSKKVAKPAGEWNEAEIKSLNGQLELFLNGEKVVSTTMWDDNWKKLIEGSKFKSMPGFGTYKKGRLALQDHSNLVWFRNIQVKKL
jgi:hypothetical protein